MLGTINKTGTATCVWCCAQVDDAIDVTFSDGLKGTLCRKHFWDALRARADLNREIAEPAREPTRSSKPTPALAQ